MMVEYQSKSKKKTFMITNLHLMYMSVNMQNKRVNKDKEGGMILVIDFFFSKFAHDINLKMF